MKKIPLTQGKYALVDDEDFVKLSKYKWHFQTRGYAGRNQLMENGKQKGVCMHRVIMNTPIGMMTDHINHDKLDNRKQNLRIVTATQNAWNTRIPKDNTSGYKGVHLSKDRKRIKKWRVYITCNRKMMFLGRYLSKEQAALKYNEMAKKHFGEYALLNEIK